MRNATASHFHVPDPEMAAFLYSLREFVLAETMALRRQIEAIWAKPLAQRVRDGFAVAAVQIDEFRRDSQLVLSCPENQSRFRPGDILCLNRGDPFTYPHFMVNLDEDEETRLVVSADIQGDWQELFRERDGWILDMGFLDLSSYVLGALADAGDTLVGRTFVLPLLMRRAQPVIDADWYGRGLAIGEAAGLNWHQCEALANAYAADLAALVQGPPGTGKTRVLAALANALAKTGERVLVCAFTHRAINNALNAILKANPHCLAIKVGHSARADDLQAPNFDTFHESPLADKSSGYIVGATPFAPRTKRLAGVEFDTVIFDEASQITLPLAIMGMLAGQKYIFFGDQKQLPPVLTTRLTGGALRSSIFEYLADSQMNKMLAETYRLNDVLAGWPSQQFYGGMLTPAATAASRRIEYPAPPARLADVLHPNHPKVFWDLAHHNNTATSHKEAAAVVSLITTLLGCGFPAGEIGVVAPYRAQGRLIRNLLREYVPETAVQRQIIIDTVERMQGQERDMIILSLTTSNPGFAATVADFFFQPERLNVAITRPRKKLIIVGSRFILNTQTTDPGLQETVFLLENLLESCTYIPDSHDLAPELWLSKW